MIQKGWIGRTRCRKVFQTMAAFGQAASMAFIPLMGCNVSALVPMLVVCYFIEGAQAGGTASVASEMSKNFPATIYAIVNMVTTTCGMMTPYLIGVILQSGLTHDVLQMWSYVFYMVACVAAVGGLVFIFFGSAERQSWDMDDDEIDDEIGDEKHVKYIQEQVYKL